MNKTHIVMQNIITIDGPAGSGKSTVARLLAKKINYLYLDTGAMYRAVALAASRKKINIKDGEKLGELCKSIDLHFEIDEDPPRLLLDKKDISLAIRSPKMDMLSSIVSGVKEVRDSMVDLQRKIAKGVQIVAEGRDMGTVVFPKAKNKFYISASPNVRTERRYKERLGRGESISKAVVDAELKKRDHQDETRSIAPLRPAKKAKIIDSTILTPEEVVEEIICHLKEK